MSSRAFADTELMPTLVSNRHWSARLARVLRTLPGAWPLPSRLHDMVFLRPAAFWPFLRRQVSDPAACFGAADGRPRVLLINHCFDQDIAALRRAAEGAGVAARVVRYQEIRELARMHFPRDVLAGVEAYNRPSLATRRARYRRALQRWVDIVQDVWPFDVVLTPSDAFFWIREFVPEVQSRGIPIVVADKEGTISPYYFDWHAAQVRQHCPFISDQLLVWSERHAAFWQQAGAPPERIHILGQPRSDLWRRSAHAAADDEPQPLCETAEPLGQTPLPLRDAPLLLFLSFERSAYIPPDLYAAGSVRWDAIFDATHTAVADFARRHTDWDVVIKAHPQQDRLAELASWVRRLDLPNVHLAAGAAATNDLIARAAVVAGFQTTAIYEAMLAGEQPIVYPFWGDAQRWADNILPIHASGAVTVARSAIEFPRALEAAAVSRRAPADQLAQRPAAVRAVLGEADGKVCQRVWAAVAAAWRSAPQSGRSG
jgi:hypothetical protein